MYDGVGVLVSKYARFGNTKRSVPKTQRWKDAFRGLRFEGRGSWELVLLRSGGRGEARVLRKRVESPSSKHNRLEEVQIALTMATQLGQNRIAI